MSADATGPLQMRIRHTTGFTYETGAVASLNEARMVPLNTSDQFVLRSRLEIKPSPWSYEYTDYWGTSVTAFEVHEPHADLTVTATSIVETREIDTAPHGLDWDAVDVVQDEFCEYVADSEVIELDDDLIGELDALRGSSAAPGDYVASVLALAHARGGRCQDVTHTAIGALRRARIPARYVSGYLHPSEAPVVGEDVAAEPHAWLEYWDGEWVGFDPTHGIAQGTRHVTVARGRDHTDNPPLRGIYSTAGGSEMFVEVEITRLR